MGVTWNHRYIIARKSTGTCFKSNYDISVGIVGNLTGQKTTKQTTFSSIALRIRQLVFFIFVKVIFRNISVHVWNVFIFETSWKIYSRQNKFVMLIFWPAFWLHRRFELNNLHKLTRSLRALFYPAWVTNGGNEAYRPLNTNSYLKHFSSFLIWK